MRTLRYLPERQATVAGRAPTRRPHLPLARGRCRAVRAFGGIGSAPSGSAVRGGRGGSMRRRAVEHGQPRQRHLRVGPLHLLGGPLGLGRHAHARPLPGLPPMVGDPRLHPRLGRPSRPEPALRVRPAGGVGSARGNRRRRGVDRHPVERRGPPLPGRGRLPRLPAVAPDPLVPGGRSPGRPATPRPTSRPTSSGAGG